MQVSVMTEDNELKAFESNYEISTFLVSVCDVSSVAGVPNLPGEPNKEINQWNQRHNLC